MSYEEFLSIRQKEIKDQTRIAEMRANKAYNIGLLEGLGFWKAYLYPVLKRPT